MENLPWYVKAFLALGGASLLWKAVQGSVPKILEWARPIALRAVDAGVAVIIANPVLRWVVIGNKENFLKTANALIDGLEDIVDAMQERLAKDLADAEAKPVAVLVAVETKPTEPPVA